MIKILSDETINKIAAGEVVERPSNVVKELVENSLDAKGENLEIEIVGAGRKLIRVKDDGTGMEKDDLLLSVQRHATSKITSFSDLGGLSTLGFRGEALPSIAAVSDLTIQSQPKAGAQNGWEIKLLGGKLKDSRSWSGSGGTNVEVANLFFNTPAREKFLKSDTTEKNRIISLIEEIALSRPDVSFRVISDKKQALAASKTKNVLERVIDLFGGEFAKGLKAVNAEHPNIKMRAFVSSREQSFPTRNYQFLFVNSRPVSLSKALSHGIYEAYRENLQAGRHPAVIIFLEVNPTEIDVNIHPTKREIRFSKEQEIRHFVFTAIRNAVLGEGVASLNIRPDTSAHPEERRAPEPHASAQYEPVFQFPKKTEASIADLKKIYGRQQEFEGVHGRHDSLRILGQLNNLYVICQVDNTMLIIDQHAAQERIKYEEYLSQWQKKRIPVQPMLFPVAVDLAPSQIGLIKENMKVLKDLGIEAEEFGGKTLRVTGLPAVLGSGPEVNDFLRAIIDAILEGTKLPDAQRVENIIRAACRSSVKAGDSLAPMEMNKLVKMLFNCKAPYTCPHGRPTAFKVSLSELEKYFGRK